MPTPPVQEGVPVPRRAQASRAPGLRRRTAGGHGRM